MSVLRTSKPDDREETLPQPRARKTAAIRKAGRIVALTGVILPLLMIGGMKFTTVEIEALRPLIGGTPWLAWMYPVAGVVSDVAYAIAVSAVATEEATARSEVMEYQPVDYEESIGKLVYIAAFLIATRLRLEDGEMVRVMETAAPFDGTG
jgi:uncharacterized membrane protein YkgB